MVMMGVRWWIAAGVALVATVMIQYTFGLLRVPLPLGLLGP
jgi:putative tricarboxylic transport membrane protein